MAKGRSGAGADSGDQEFDSRHGRPERLNTLIDGVYAIIMTILVLELKLPDGLTPAAATGYFFTLGPRFLAFGVSFGVAAAGWAYTHTAGALFVRSNTTHVAINLLALMFASLIPFCASVLGSLPNSVLAPQVYALVVAAQSGSYLLDLALCHRQLFPTRVSRRLIYAIIASAFAATVFMSFVGVVVAPWSPRLALGLIVLHFVAHWALLWMFSRPIQEAVHGAMAD